MPSRRSPLVLVAEGDPDLLLLLARELTAAGFWVAAAPDGRAAQEELKRVSPDAVVAGVDLAYVDGVQLCIHVRARYPELPILLHVSSRAVFDPDVTCLGDIEMVPKSAGTAEVVRRLRALLHVEEG